MQAQDVSDQVARTVAVNTLVAGQLFYLFNARKIKEPAIGKDFFHNKYAFMAAGALVVIQIVFVYVPFMNTFFGTSPIELELWLYPLVAGITVFFIVEGEKFIARKLQKNKE